MLGQCCQPEPLEGCLRASNATPSCHCAHTRSAGKCHEYQAQPAHRLATAGPLTARIYGSTMTKPRRRREGRPLHKGTTGLRHPSKLEMVASQPSVGFAEAKDSRIQPDPAPSWVLCRPPSLQLLQVRLPLGALPASRSVIR